MENLLFHLLLLKKLKHNIFLRSDDPDVKKAINLENASDIEIFTKLRDLKDNF